MTDSFRFARNTSMGTRARRKACHDTIPSIKASFTSEGKHTYLTRGRDRLKIGLRIDEAGGRGGERGEGCFAREEGKGWVLIIHECIILREGRYVKIRRAIDTAKGSMQRSEYVASS